MISKMDAYRIFSEVARHQSFSRAAKALYMTQPAVSQTIMNLERDLNIRLFTRTSKGVTLTTDGQLLFEYITSAISLIEAGERKISESRDLMFGELKIGVGDTISRYYLLPFLEKFHSNSPNIRLKIINRTTPELIRMVKSGDIDIAICNLPLKDSAIEVLQCMTVHDVFICGEKYKSLSQIPQTLEEIVKYPLIFLERKSNSRQLVEKHLASRGIKLEPEIELGSHELLLEFTKYNFGISCVIEEFSQEYLQKGLLYRIHLSEEIPERSIGFCYLKGVSLSAAVREFVRITQGL
ncbi:MAG: LysR family transcriptional regulator [Thermoclostridium sp.]|nr:LysR family transcriptional regulator [Thermoclostridium sp.]